MALEKIKKIIEFAISKDASDIHLQTGRKPILRIYGKLLQVEDGDDFTLDDKGPEIEALLTERQLKIFREKGSVDFAINHDAENRLRGNLYQRNKGLTISLRIVRNKILSFEELGLPEIFKHIAEDYKQGFFLIVGPTGEGKTTSLASIINYVNQQRAEHILTIEDPIEYIVENHKSIIDQREIGTHADSFGEALRSSMRQDPNIIVIGEMRDQETMQAAITLAETGHLVLSTMHTNNTAQTIDRIIDTFPENKQKQIRIQLASTLSGVISQRLIPGVDGKLVFAYEQMLMNDATRNIIRTEKVEQIYNALEGNDGSVRMEKCLVGLVKEGKISREMAEKYASNKELLDLLDKYNQED